jgi:hypothetical protein
MTDGTGPGATGPRALSAELMTTERAYMARWLALEVLMTDEAVCADEDLFNRLSELQDKWQEETLAKHGAKTWALSTTRTGGSAPALPPR